ncbi:MAG: polysaccharide export protein, outer membrane [Spirochaetae bacterium HGW-Spirochaetae-1]|jgi:polysaccharide export outer membrane protein|nr:MAG: polysaccharide export protein, outer membrane [Spirochaetae bacterium HGW-Spirochaetae-1]
MTFRILKKFVILTLSSLCILCPGEIKSAQNEQYIVGVGDILEVNIIQPEQLQTRTTVSPGGDISIPYIGSVRAKGQTITQLQQTIQWRLANGYFKYPVVTVSLIESRSKNYTISGEVVTPGNYPLGENTTVLKAISIAGGFTRFGSSSRVKILRPRQDRPGYRQIKVDIKAVMDGDARADIVIEAGDIIVVSEGIF